ncbi:MAG: hypothetical protein HKN95_00610 [Acidimicrobiia bacterium]|nr:hypothetical protein [Acidimicrobiia bacterium]
MVTWYGKPGGEIGVLWASSVDLDIRLFEDAPETLIPEFVGKLSEADIDAVKERLKELGASSRDIMSPASAQGVPGPICSLNIHNPYWSFGLDEAVGWSHQVCSNMLDHFVESKIRQQRWWNSYRTIGHETSGWGSSSYLQAIATGTCNSSAEKRWKNWGNGDATGLDGTHYNGPSASTNAFKLGCKH